MELVRYSSVDTEQNKSCVISGFCHEELRSSGLLRSVITQKSAVLETSLICEQKLLLWAGDHTFHDLPTKKLSPLFMLLVCKLRCIDPHTSQSLQLRVAIIRSCSTLLKKVCLSSSISRMVKHFSTSKWAEG